MINIAPLLTRYLSPLLLSAVALTSLPIAAQAGNMYIYKDKSGQVLPVSYTHLRAHET